MNEFSPHHEQRPATLSDQIKELTSDVPARVPLRLPYDHLHPRNDDACNPTPLDPSHAAYFVDGDDTVSYVSASGVMLDSRLEEAVDAVGMPREDVSSAYERAHAEIVEGHNGRIRRNDESYQRLLEAIERKKKPIDDAMFDIIQAARAGAADWPQLVRLIKEYPEMISVEAFKFTKPFSDGDRDEARALINEKVRHLQATFRDAVVTVYDSWEELKKPFIDEDGVRVRKYRIAEIRSETSHTELIVKETDLIVPPDMPLSESASRSPVDIVSIEGTNYDARLLPFGITAYLLTGEYKKRAGYHEPDLASRAMGAAALKSSLDADLALLASEGHGIEFIYSIPEDMRATYVERAAGALRTRLKRERDGQSDETTE